MQKELFDEVQRKAANGNISAIEDLANAYYYGCENETYGYSDVKKNLNESRKWYFKAAEKGSAVGKMHMGEFYLFGIAEVSKNNKRAFKYLCDAVSINKNLTLAHELLGHCYFNGLGTKENHKKANEHFQMAVNTGSSSAEAELGLMYLYGDSVKQNLQTAYELFSKSAKENVSRAEYGLGIMFNKGYYVDKNFEKANEWFCKAMEHGNLDAKVHYAVNCLFNQGVEDKEEYGVKLLEEAVDEEHEYADIILSEYLETADFQKRTLEKLYNI